VLVKKMLVLSFVSYCLTLLLSTFSWHWRCWCAIKILLTHSCHIFYK